MTLSTICKGCGVEITGEDEEELVTNIQTHLADAHPEGHRPSRDQVLAVLRSRASEKT